MQNYMVFFASEAERKERPRQSKELQLFETTEKEKPVRQRMKVKWFKGLSNNCWSNYKKRSDYGGETVDDLISTEIETEYGHGGGKSAFLFILVFCVLCLVMHQSTPHYRRLLGVLEKLYKNLYFRQIILSFAYHICKHYLLFFSLMVVVVVYIAYLLVAFWLVR